MKNLNAENTCSMGLMSRGGGVDSVDSHKLDFGLTDND